jgi:hypothetical protein
VLGEWSDNLRLGGVDLDSCRDATTGALQPWAQDVLDLLSSYAEVSPSGTGVKAFFGIEPDAVDALREARLLPSEGFGRSFKRGTGTDHPPAIEVHLHGRYYTVTGQRLPDAPAELRTVSTAELGKLLGDIGPAFAGARSGQERPDRSAMAFATAGRIKAAGGDYSAFLAALDEHPDTAAWKVEKGSERELRRAWDRAEAPAWGRPAMTVLHRSSAPAPELPLDVFGTFWAGWIKRTAEGANAPPDYVAMPLLAVTSALLGNARWVSAWRGWAEPPALWCGSVGNPSSGKSSGASMMTRDVLRLVEQHMARDYPAELKRWEEVEAVTRAALKQWEKDVASALKAGDPVPAKPDAATIPPKPIRPRASMTDATVESLGPLLAGLPKGVLNLRDEMAGWLLNLSRYSNGGTDRPFWLEAYAGGPYQIDRQKYPVPLFIPHLTLPAFGTIQPERLADILGGADDGLSSRFLWAWPETTRRFGRPRDAGDAHQAAAALQRLADLSMVKNESGEPVPSYIRLADDAQAVLVDFGQQMQDREAAAHGLLKSSIGKARGQALRLALVLEYLWWAEGDGAEPAQVTRGAMEAAAGLMDCYFLPMAARVLGDASIPEDERDARTLAAWIMEQRPEVVNVSAIRDDARLPGLRDSDAVKGACRFLVEAHWLAEPERNGQGGRPRGDYRVNPALLRQAT